MATAPTVGNPTGSVKRDGLPVKHAYAFSQITSNLDDDTGEMVTDEGLDLADTSIFNFTIGIKTVADSAPGASMTLTVYYAFSNDSDVTDPVSELDNCKDNFVTSLTNSGSAIDRNHSDLLNAKAQYLYIWYNIDDIDSPLVSLDVVINVV